MYIYVYIHTNSSAVGLCASGPRAALTASFQKVLGGKMLQLCSLKR